MHALYGGAVSRQAQTRAFIAALLISTCAVGTANAATFNVTDQASYDAAVAAANSSAGPHTINILVAGTYNQNVAATFTGEINIATSGAVVQGISANEYNSNLRITVGSGATFSTGAFQQTIGSLAGSGTLDT